MDFAEVLSNRRSVRKFKKDEIHIDIINNIIESAKLAPVTDTCNYYFGVIKDKKIKEELSKATHYADWVSTAPVIIACCSDISWDIANEEDDSYGVIGSTLRYSSEIVHFLRNHSDRRKCKTLTLASPIYIAAQHIILSAVSQGLRGCFVDFINIDSVDNILKLPENITCQLLVPLGYADETPKERYKQPDNNVFYDTYGEA